MNHKCDSCLQYEKNAHQQRWAKGMYKAKGRAKGILYKSVDVIEV